MPAANRNSTTPIAQDFGAPVAALDWVGIEAELDAQGVGLTGQVLDAEACAGLRGLYDDPAHFRSRIVMARHGFGRGEYQYFAHPLPEPIAALRPLVYARLAPIANRWNERLGIAQRYPERLDAFLALCHQAGQQRPTPLLLKYEAGDYNCLHQDLYGDLFFPFQMVILLSQPGRDFTGGEFVLLSSVRACSRGRRWCRWRRERRRSSPCSTDRSKARAAPTGLICAMASAGSAAARASRPG